MDPSGHIVRPSRTLALGAAVLASLLALSSTAAAGVVASESFETGLPSPSQQYSVDEDVFDQNTTGPASAPNVTFSGFSGIVTNDFTVNSSGFLTPGGSNIFPDTTFGNQVAFLQSFQGGGRGDIDWAITGLHPGQEYVLSFEDVTSSILGATPFSVSAFGATPVDYESGASFTTETLDFTPSTANGSIDFIGSAASDNSLSAIDNLTISTISTAPGVPEPATWAMMLVGFGGLGAAMRRSRRRAVRALA
jgi:hypothetical protein